MAIFISAKTSLKKCMSLGDQIRVMAMRAGGGWIDAKEDLATTAQEWFGREPMRRRSDFESVCSEVFRND